MKCSAKFRVIFLRVGPRRVELLIRPARAWAAWRSPPTPTGKQRLISILSKTVRQQAPINKKGTKQRIVSLLPF